MYCFLKIKQKFLTALEKVEKQAHEGTEWIKNNAPNGLKNNYHGFEISLDIKHTHCISIWSTDFSSEDHTTTVSISGHLQHKDIQLHPMCLMCMVT
jgi:hypothetical protein